MISVVSFRYYTDEAMAEGRALSNETDTPEHTPLKRVNLLSMAATTSICGFMRVAHLKYRDAQILDRGTVSELCRMRDGVQIAGSSGAGQMQLELTW